MNRRSQSLRSLKRAPWIDKEWTDFCLAVFLPRFWFTSGISIYNFILDNSIALSSAKQIVTYVMNNQPKAEFPDTDATASNIWKSRYPYRYRLSYVPGFLINSH